MRNSSFLLLLCLLLFSALPAAAQGPAPSLVLLSPANDATVPGRSVTVTFRVADFRIVPSTVPLSEAGKHPELNRPGEGHLHLMLDLQPLIVWDRDTPYVFDPMPDGPHQLMVELANNDHSSLSPRVVQTIRFRSEGNPVVPVTGASGTAPVIPRQWVVLAAGALLAAGVVLQRQGARR